MHDSLGGLEPKPEALFCPEQVVEWVPVCQCPSVNFNTHMGVTWELVAESVLA